MSKQQTKSKIADGEPVTFFLTAEQRHAFNVKRAEAGYTSNTAFIIEALGLDKPQASK